MIIILRTSIVESMRKFVGSDSPECPILQVRRPFVRVKGRLQDTGREDDFAVSGCYNRSEQMLHG
jgi:hypothetical protein